MRQSRSRLVLLALWMTLAAFILGGLSLFQGAPWLPWHWAAKVQSTELSGGPKREGGLFYPTPSQWATLTVEAVEQRVFRSEHVTEGKIAIDEDRATPIFSPYAGRAVRLMAKPGDIVERGQPLFVVEATESVQVQNDFIAAVGALNKARSQLNLATIVEKRQRELFEGKAVALKELQQAQADLTAAQNDVRSAEILLESARNRLRILGRTEQEIAAFQTQGRISPETVIPSPIAGTVVQRKVGPGQYVSAGASDPAYVIGDLSTVWLVAYVRETEASKVYTSQALVFSVLAAPDRVYQAKIDYVAAAIDTATRRLLVRTRVDNPDGRLKPEMFATVTIFIDAGESSPAVPSDAVIYEGDTARVWMVRENGAVALQRIKTGTANGRMLQVLAGLKAGDKVVTKGALFIDRVAAGT